MGDIMIQGIDVSNWQGEINWPKVADAGIKFAFIKATEGQSYVDPRLQSNVSGAKMVGLKIGLYHFLSVGDVNPLTQARHFVSTIKDITADWLVCDVEEHSDNVSMVVSHTREWLQEVESLTQKRPLIYTYLDYANTVLGNSFTNWPLWIAQYGAREPSKTAWPTWVCWQYSNTGEIDGILGKVDLNDMKEDFFAAQEPVEPWKLEIMEKALDIGLITERHNPDDLAQKWFVLAVALNSLKIMDKL